MNNEYQLTYISNAGVLLKIKDKKILIDPFACTKRKFYKDTPIEIKEKLITGTKPYNNIDIVLITHEHPDHFNTYSIVRFLEKNPNCNLISNNKTILNIKNAVRNPEAYKLIELSPPLHGRETIEI